MREARDNAIATLQTELDKIKGELEEKVSSIAKLEKQLSGVMSNLEVKEQAIANLKAELAAGEVKQLTLFPPDSNPTPELTPTPEPVTEPTPTPEPTPEMIKPESTPKPQPKSKSKAKSKPKQFPEGSLSAMELIAHIEQKFPGDNIEYSDLNDALTLKNGKPKTKNLPGYKEKYGFEYLGKFSGQRRFQLV